MDPSNNTGTEQQVQDKVRFPIRAKLITIISIIVIFALGTSTALVSYIVSDTLKSSAENNNLEANRRAAEEAENALTNIRTVSGQFLYTINALEAQSASVQEAADFFFNQNPRAIAFTYKLKGTQKVLVNRDYFSPAILTQPLRKLTLMIMISPSPAPSMETRYC